MRKVLLFPFSLLYGVVVYLRNRLYDWQLLKSVKFDLPVISVGNITVGGTGKTPHTEYLISMLQENFRVAVLSRGYRRKTKGFVVAAFDSTVSQVGDEPLQIKQKFPRITVSVCENRVIGVEKLLSAAPKPEIILLDDAYQHRRISPGLNILLIDSNRPPLQDYLLPAGLLREPVAEIRRADVVVFTKCPDAISPSLKDKLLKLFTLTPKQEVFFTTFRYGGLKPVFPEYQPANQTIAMKNSEVIALTGIANPHPFYQWLENQGFKIHRMSFPDHYSFTEKDIESILRIFEKILSENKWIVTTEKDAVRLRDLQTADVRLKKILWYTRIEVEFLEDKKQKFNKIIFDYVGKNT